MAVPDLAVELDGMVAETDLSDVDLGQLRTKLVRVQNLSCLGQLRTELVEGSKPYPSANSQFHRWDRESEKPIENV